MIASVTTSQVTTSQVTTSQPAYVLWTTERVDLLRRHFEAGLTCRQIANAIGVTRNAVIGKIHRLGLSRPRSARAPAERTGPRMRRPGILTQRWILRAVFAEAPSLAEAPVESLERCSLIELGQGRCRWPIDEPGAASFSFCGNRSVSGLSYCAGHARIAYRTPERRYARRA